MVKTIDRKELGRLVIAKSNLRVVDVLSKEHFEQEHIKGAISLPLDEIESRAGEVLRKDDTIAVYCAGFSCSASTTAAEKLMSLGYMHVLDYKGGLEDYKKSGLALEGERYNCCEVLNCCCGCD